MNTLTMTKAKGKKVLPALATLLPHELLVKIFYNLEERPQHRHTSNSSISFSSSLSLDRTDILSCTLVCRDWYYAAVNTLWRDVDMHSVESFIQLSGTLDPAFSYMDANTATVKTMHGYGYGHEYDTQFMDADDDPDRNDEQQGECRTGELSRDQRRPTHPSMSSLSSSSSCTTVSSSSSLSLSSISSMGYSPIPESHIGHAGKDYIRSFSVAGSSDCQAPRPFPYLPSCINDRHIIALSASFTRLISLSLCHCTALTDMAVIQLITASSPYLKRIDLTECRLVTNLTVQVIAQLCSQKLEDLSLQGCGLVTDDAIEEVAYCCTRLRKINIGQCHRATDRALIALLQQSSGKLIPQLDFDQMSDTRTNNPRLTNLGVAGCQGVTFTGLLAISEYLSFRSTEETTEMDCGKFVGARGKRMQSSLLSLEFTCPPLKKTPSNIQHGHPHNVTSSLSTGAQTLSQASRFFQTLPTTLEEIMICDAFTLSHDDMVCLVDRIGPSLKSLRLDNANAIKSETLTHVLSACPNLTALCIPRATRLDDAGVIQLTTAKCARSLVELDLSACHALTDVCLTRLATSRPPQHLYLHQKGKSIDVEETELPCLLPSLRRLDLSYNDKLTLTGIIPLVMSLKNLCALDVSFCGNGVTRRWSSSLESLRPILNPTATTNSALGCDMLGGVAADEATILMDEGPLPFSSEQSLVTGVTTSMSAIQRVLSLQSLQQLVNGVIPLVIPSRPGLGRYVGPLLNRPVADHQDNTIVPQHPLQYPGQGQVGGVAAEETSGALQYGRRRSSASSTSSVSTAASSSSSSSIISTPKPSISAASSSSSPNPCSTRSHHNTTDLDRLYHQHQKHTSSSQILLADRLDVLDIAPGRVGLPASYHLESWFTPQHQQQLQHLFQIQLQHQRDWQAQQAAVAMAGLGIVAAGQNNLASMVTTLLGGGSTNPGAGVGASLPEEMMAHPVMMAARAGAATTALDDGEHGHNGQHQDVPEEIMELNDNLNINLHLGAAPSSVGRLTGSGSGTDRRGATRHHQHQHHHRHHQHHPQQPHHRQGSIGRSGDINVSGYCEISAWGLNKLKEEWTMI